ncbi:hypothetical protein MATL_G00260750 [Megalops atlanticus]|uniref:Uncharacterized protein n=1 Tax=Megalops atlanticus TaxID=7932 RepID=A0A9D3STG8_MEGAT|nr:hypothetical protein MATL_G00260750 [Megalops atlanticus]
MPFVRGWVRSPTPAEMLDSFRHGCKRNSAPGFACEAHNGKLKRIPVSVISSPILRRKQQRQGGWGRRRWGKGGTNRCRIHAVAARPHCRLTLEAPRIQASGHTRLGKGILHKHM